MHINIFTAHPSCSLFIFSTFELSRALAGFGIQFLSQREAIDTEVCLVKTSCTRKINDFQRACSQVLR